jgi:C1A family cysteine protease
MNKEQYKKLTGGLKKSIDPKVWQYNNISSNSSYKHNEDLPATFRLWDSAIKNQQEKSTCVAHALASAMEILEYYDTGDRNQFSTSWYYGYRQNTDYQGEGMSIVEALENARIIGGVHKSLMPDNLHYTDTSKVIQDMEEECLVEAEKHRIKNYAEISNIHSIPDAIYYNNSPVIIGIDVYESFYNVGTDGIIPVPNTKIEKYYGGHAMLCIGWTTIKDDLYLVIKNSWGEYWGDNGYCYLKVNSKFPLYEMYLIFDEQNYNIDFKDIKGRWSEDYINDAIKMGILNGYEDGTFKPTQNITREEIAVIVSKIMDKFKYL